MYQCPLCGKSENRRGNPFESIEPVVSHIDGCHDDVHADTTGHELREEIEATAGDAGTVEETPETADEPTDDSTTVDMTREEYDEIIEATQEYAREQGYEAGYEEGFEEGYEAAKEELNGGETADGRTCPDCGGVLNPTPTGMRFYSEDVDDYARAEEGDTYCPTCEIVVEPDGSVIN